MEFLNLLLAHGVNAFRKAVVAHNASFLKLTIYLYLLGVIRYFWVQDLPIRFLVANLYLAGAHVVEALLLLLS